RVNRVRRERKTRPLFTNVVIDVPQRREPYSADSYAVVMACARGQVEGWFTAKEIRADYIVTRNVDDFKNSSIPAVSPTDFKDLEG
ncbi:MAG: hypothetical protein Q4A01_06530, partial [Coriobacteriales bacterium]|nr:hypothetical protein [Coriobacteriales bacterium]